MDHYSRTVAYLKVLLPLAALGILSTVFLLSRNTNPTATIPFAEHEVAERMRDRQITGPVFSGITPQGDEITITARTARPSGPDSPATATDFRGSMTSVDGLKITLNSDTGSVDISDNRATFSGSVQIETTTGYVLETDLLNTALDSIQVETPGRVVGYSPIGTVSAGQMVINAENDGGSMHMLFKNGVKLVYTPKQPER